MAAGGKLTDLRARQIKEPGIYPDGGGLYLQVTKGADGSPRKSWIVRVRLPGGRSRDMGLGRFDLVPLKAARDLAIKARQDAAAGNDPVAAKAAQRVAAAVADARAMTFRQCAEAYIAAHESDWRNPKHRQQWRNTLATYAYPVFGNLPVAAVDTSMVMKVLDPIWRDKRETASRLRGRIEVILDWARVRGYRDGENPARWKGLLEYSLPAKGKRVRPHPSLPYAEMPNFWSQLSEREGPAADVLRLTILTAVRTTEALHARWEEFDLSRRVWTIPGNDLRTGRRMKGGREHRVPLSDPVLELLRRIGPKQDGYVFPGFRGPKRPLSNMAMLMLLERMGRRGTVTIHGFRSTATTWGEEFTNHPRPVIDAALAHQEADKVLAAYSRGDFFEKRRAFMADWAAYVTTANVGADKVVSLRKPLR